MTASTCHSSDVMRWYRRCPLCDQLLGRSPLGWARHNTSASCPCPATERRAELPAWIDCPVPPPPPTKDRP